MATKTGTAGTAKAKQPNKVSEAVKKARENMAATKAAISGAYDKGFADGYMAAQ